MDVVTQGLLGAAIAAVWFRERLGPRSLVYAAACGVAPDLDVLALASGYWTALECHRGWTHSLIVLSLAAPVLGALASAKLGRGRGGERGAWIHLTFWALVTHPLLDLFTSFGTQLLAPVSRARFALDGVGAADPFVTAPLLVALMLARSSQGRAASRRGLVALALAWSVCYLLIGAGVSMAARNDHRAALVRGGFTPEATRALISPGLPLVRRLVARDGDGNLAVALWSPWAGVTCPVSLPAAREPAVARALSSRRGRLFQWFADGYVYAEVRRSSGDTVVRLSDQRFGVVTELIGRSMFQVEMTIKTGKEEIEVEPVTPPPVRVAAELAAGWRLSRPRAFGSGAGGGCDVQ